MTLRSVSVLALAGAIVATSTTAVSLQAQAQAQTQTDQQTKPQPPRQTTPPADPQATLKDRVAHRLETHATLRKYDIKVAVNGGVATLTGKVATQAQKNEAQQVATKVQGVTKVENQIQVDPNEDKSLGDRMKSGLSKAGETITDAWITTKIKWFYMFEDLLDDSEINVDTANKVVTLKGTVPTAAAKTRALELAKATEGVSRVVDQITVGK